MLSAEQTFFLSVLADHLNGRQSAPVPGLDWKSLYNVTEKHRVSALFYAQCGTFLPPEAELPFLQDYGAAVADYAARREIAAEIDREFTRHRIPFIIVKGLAVAECYPNPELRTMGDVDVVVKAEDKQRAHGILLELGFQNTGHQDCEWIYWKDSHEIELHHRLLYDETANAPSSRLFADRIWEYVHPVPDSSRCELDPSFHFLFLVMHLKKHIANFGAGFRQFIDLAVAARSWRLDWAQLEAWLAEVELRSFAEVCLTLCRRWFQLPLPLAGAELSPEFEQEMRQQIFRNGVYGFDDAANRNNAFITRINAAGGKRFRKRLQLCREELTRLPAGLRGKTWSVLFPGYEVLRKTENYGFVNHRPWLLPAAWSYRFIHCLGYKIKRSCMILLYSCGAVRKRNETLKKLGLSAPAEER